VYLTSTKNTLEKPTFFAICNITGPLTYVLYLGVTEEGVEFDSFQVSNRKF